MPLDMDSTPVCRTQRLVPGRLSALYSRYSPPAVRAALTWVMDAVIFASAVVITACHYLTGTLQATNPFKAPPTPATYPLLSVGDPLQIQRRHPSYALTQQGSGSVTVSHVRKRTLDWVDQQQQIKTRPRPLSASLVMGGRPPLSPPLSGSVRSFHQYSSPSSYGLARHHGPKRDKRRTQSLPQDNTASSWLLAQQKEEERFSRMEERLQSLIEEGQAALSRKPEPTYDDPRLGRRDS